MSTTFVDKLVRRFKRRYAFDVPGGRCCEKAFDRQGTRRTAEMEFRSSATLLDATFLTPFTAAFLLTIARYAAKVLCL